MNQPEDINPGSGSITYREIARIAEYIVKFVDKNKEIRGSNLVDGAELISLWLNKYSGYFQYLIDMEAERDDAVRQELFVQYQLDNPDKEAEKVAKDEADEAHNNFVMAAITFVDMLLGDIPWSSDELGQMPKVQRNGK